MLAAYAENPSFLGDAIGAGDINHLVNNAYLLDEATRRGRYAFVSRSRWWSDYVGSTAGPLSPAGQQRLWWGSMQFQVGFTDAQIVVYQESAAAHQFVVRFDEVEVYRTSGGTTPAGETLITIDLTGRGYAHNQIIDVDVQRTSPNPSNHAEVRDAHVGPVSGTIGFVFPGGGAAFTNQASRTQMQELAQAGDWVARALAGAREPLPMATKFLDNQGLTNGSRTLLAGTFVRDVHTDRFAVAGYIQTPNAVQETLRLVVDGTVVDSTVRNRGSYGPFTYDYDMSSLAVGQHTWQLVAFTNTQGPEKRTHEYYSMHWALTRKNGLYPDPYPLPPQRVAKQDAGTALWLDDLNRVRLHFFEARNRLVASADTFNRVRMFSRRLDIPNINTNERDTYFGLLYVAQAWRRGEGIWISGKNIKLCYGGTTATPPTGQTGSKLWSYTADNEIALTASDKIETKYIPFDTLSGLSPEDLFYLTGDVRGAFHVWRS